MENLIDLIIFNGSGVYRVQEGDSLDNLAQKYSTTKAILIYDNNLSGEINEGDALFIRTFKNVYTVGVLDTPKIIEEKLNITIEKLYEINKINYLYPYQRIIYDEF